MSDARTAEELAAILRDAAMHYHDGPCGDAVDALNDLIDRLEAPSGGFEATVDRIPNRILIGLTMTDPLPSKLTLLDWLIAERSSHDTLTSRLEALEVEHEAVAAVLTPPGRFWFTALATAHDNAERVMERD